MILPFFFHRTYIWWVQADFPLHFARRLVSEQREKLRVLPDTLGQREAQMCVSIRARIVATTNGFVLVIAIPFNCRL